MEKIEFIGRDHSYPMTQEEIDTVRAERGLIRNYDEAFKQEVMDCYYPFGTIVKLHGLKYIIKKKVIGVLERYKE